MAKSATDKQTEKFRSKMKVGWEDTFIAENIFTRAVSIAMAEGRITEAVIEHLAETSCNAVRIWKRVAKTEGFHHDIVTDAIEDQG